jgi:uncharacterized iron-regulated membrane protein
MKLRTLIFWPHLIAGVVAGVVILIMSVTGVILTYERQLIAWSNSHLQSTPPAEGAADSEHDPRRWTAHAAVRPRQRHPPGCR